MRTLQLFVELLQVAIGCRADLSVAPTPDEWSVIYGHCERQALVGVGYVGLQRIPRTQWPVCITPIVSLPLLYVVYYAFKNKDYTNAWLCLFLGLVIFIPSAGSDTGFQKSLMSACGIIPIAVVKYINVHKKMLYINIALGIMFSTSVFMYSDNLCNNNAVSSDKKLWGVFLNKRQLEHNQMIKEDLKPYYRTNHTVFYGLEAHYWYFYTDTKPLYNPGFWMLKNDKSALDNAIASLKRDPNNVFIDFTKSDTNYFIKKGIRSVIETDFYNIYKY